MNGHKNILVNLLSVSHKSATGGFVYIANLLPALFDNDTQNRYLILLNLDNFHYFKKKYPPKINVGYVVCDIRRDFIRSPIRAGLKLWAKFTKNRELQENTIRREVQDLIKKNKIDLLFCPASVIYPSGLKDVKIVSTVLDLQHEYMPGNFSPTYLKRRIADCRYVINASDHIIAISEFTKKTLLEKLNVTPDKISVVYLAAQIFGTSTCIDNLPAEYIFYPAAFWPHKNHRMLVNVLNRLKNNFPKLGLVFSGVVKNEKLRAGLVSLAESYGLRERVIFLGRVPIAGIFKNASLLAFPSSFEGFGIPLVEAFSLGVPVVAADNTSITEIVDGAGMLVPTGDEKAFAEAVTRVLTDANLREELVRKGYERAKDFSWDKAARETLAIFNSL